MKHIFKSLWVVISWIRSCGSAPPFWQWNTSFERSYGTHSPFVNIRQFQYRQHTNASHSSVLYVLIILSILFNWRHKAYKSYSILSLKSITITLTSEVVCTNIYCFIPVIFYLFLYRWIILLPDLTFDNLILFQLTQHRLWNNFSRGPHVGQSWRPKTKTKTQTKTEMWPIDQTSNKLI